MNSHNCTPSKAAETRRIAQNQRSSNSRWKIRRTCGQCPLAITIRVRHGTVSRIRQP
ncbi:hypothetical protein D3C85_1621130 [compost metagenome]